MFCRHTRNSYQFGSRSGIMNVSVMSLSMVREGGGVEVEVDCEEETLAAEFHATIVEK